MIIYKDILSGRELCSDSYPCEVIHGVAYRFKGKYGTIKDGIDDSLIGGNKSVEQSCDDEGADDQARTVIDIVDAHKLEEIDLDKKQYKTAIAAYSKKILESIKPEEVPDFKKNIQEFMREILGEFKDFKFYAGPECYDESPYDGKSMIILAKWNDEGVPYFYFIKHGLEEEKC